MTDTLFCYGILMFPEILQAALGRVPPMREARLPDHGRFGLRHDDGQTWAAIAPRSGQQVNGRCLFGITPAEWHCLDRIEEVDQGWYVRDTVIAEVAGQGRLSVQAYLAAPARRAHLRGDWLPDRFTSDHIEAFIRIELPRLR